MKHEASETLAQGAVRLQPAGAPLRLTDEQLSLLRSVQDLCERGRLQAEIAGDLGVSLSTLKYRLGRMGFQLSMGSVLVAAMTNETLTELVARGEIVLPESAVPE